MDFDIIRVMQALAKERPVFHSEADFQHALAWKIQQIYPKFGIRLEQRFQLLNGNYAYIDLILRDEIQNKKIFIELKYKTSAIKVHINSEYFELRSHTAYTDNRRHFNKDIQRLEDLLSTNKNSEAYAVFLTNDALYNQGNSINCLHNYRESNPLSLNQKLAWYEYSNLESVNTQFCYLVVKVLH